MTSGRKQRNDFSRWIVSTAWNHLGWLIRLTVRGSLIVDKNVMEFMSFCRVAAVKELRKLYSLQSRSKKSGLSIKKVTPVSIPNEVDMWKFIIENLQARLKKYPTSLAYDLRLQRKNKQLTFN